MPPSPHKSRPTRETGPKKRAPRTPKNSKTPNSPRVSKATKATVAAANGDPPAGAGNTTTATNSGPSNVTKYVEGVSRYVAIFAVGILLPPSTCWLIHHPRPLRCHKTIRAARRNLFGRGLLASATLPTSPRVATPLSGLN